MSEARAERTFPRVSASYAASAGAAPARLLNAMASQLFVIGGAYLAVLGVVIFVLLFGPNPVFQVTFVHFACFLHALELDALN